MKKILISFSLILLIAIVPLNFIHEDKELVSNNDSNQNLDGIVGVYLEDENGEYISSSDIPLKDGGYTFNHAVCENDIEVLWNEDTWSLIVPNGITNFKCNLYFDKEISVSETLLANYSTKLKRSSFTSTVTNTTTGAIYYEDTSKGRTYYFAGNPTDNWVKFGGFYWRIIRINEDGTVRMIYQGTSANATGSGTQIQTSAFNTLYENPMYVGYMYGGLSGHGLTSSSTIKGVLDGWYQDNLIGATNKIDGNAGFCGDRTLSTTTGGITYYEAYNRLDENKAPTFECQNSSDLYTTSESNQGNKALTYPIGLITADEIAYAGGVVRANNTSYYLYTGQVY